MAIKSVKQRRQPKYLEISQRNQVSRIFIGKGSTCSRKPIDCNDVCIDIVRAGVYDCRDEPQTCYRDCCGKTVHIPKCDPNVATVCAVEIDDDGWAVFEWPKNLLGLKQGWYQGFIRSACSECGEIPIRIGPRCNVIEVETIVSGPDSACYVGCDEDVCGTDPCLDGFDKHGQPVKPIYRPTYE